MKRVKVSKRQKEENAYRVRRDFLRREQEYGHANLVKYTKKWSKLLTAISCDHLRKGVISWWHSFNKAIDYKDMEISLVLDWIQSENQCYWKCLANHDILMEYLIDFFYKGHKQIYNDLGTQVNELISLWVKGYNLNRTRIISNVEYLDTMKYQMECIKKDEEFETITKNFSTYNEKNTRYKILLGDINYILSDRFDKLEWNIKEFTYGYFSKIGKKQKLGLESMEKYESLQKDIAVNHKKKTNLERQLQLLVLKYNDLLNEKGRLLKDIMKEKDCLHGFFLVFRDNLFKDKNNDMLKRQVLSVSFNETFQKLENLAKRGSMLLKFMSVCRRYESTLEEVLPYPEELIVVDKHDVSQNKNACQELSLLWNRVASVNASRSEQPCVSSVAGWVSVASITPERKETLLIEFTMVNSIKRVCNTGERIIEFTMLMFLIKKSLEDWDYQHYKTDISESHMKVMRFGLEELRKRWNKMAMTENFGRRNEASSRHIHQVQGLSFLLELQLDGLWDHIRSTEEDYWQRVRENKKHHDSIKKTDDATNKTVKKELKKLMNLQVVAKRLASKFAELVFTVGMKLEYLNGEKESLHELQFALRNKLMQDKDNDALKRSLMSTEFVKAFDRLNSKLKKGRNMIMVLKGTRRYKINREKILPYPNNSCDLEEDQMSSIPQLRQFWQSVAEADVYRYTLNEERTYLKAKNKNLMKEIHSYCKCLECPSLPQIPQRAGKIPYTEGREMIQKQKIQNRRRN